MSRCCCPPTSGQRNWLKSLPLTSTRKESPKLNPSWRVGGSRGSSDICVLKFGDDSRGRRFEDYSILALLCERIFDIRPTLGSQEKDVSRYQILSEAAHMILAQALALGSSSDWTMALIARRVKSFPLAEYAARYWHSTRAILECVITCRGGDEMPV